jgi:hypothetical protein
MALSETPAIGMSPAKILAKNATCSSANEQVAFRF